MDLLNPLSTLLDLEIILSLLKLEASQRFQLFITKFGKIKYAGERRPIANAYIITISILGIWCRPYIGMKSVDSLRSVRSLRFRVPSVDMLAKITTLGPVVAALEWAMLIVDLLESLLHFILV